MFGSKHLETKLDAILHEIESFKRTACILKQLVWELQKEKRDLLDRLMARGFEEYKLGTYSPEPSRSEDSQVLPDEEKIGSVVE